MYALRLYTWVKELDLANKGVEALTELADDGAMEHLQLLKHVFSSRAFKFYSLPQTRCLLKLEHAGCSER